MSRRCLDVIPAQAGNQTVFTVVVKPGAHLRFLLKVSQSIDHGIATFRGDTETGTTVSVVSAMTGWPFQVPVARAFNDVTLLTTCPAA